MKNNKKNNQRYLNAKWTVNRVASEINKGLSLLNKIEQPIVTVLGSHRSKPGSKYYEHAKNLGYELGRVGFAVATGGGPGIMEAANAGAFEAGTVSVGIKAGLLKNEKIDSKYFTKQISHHFLFVRRFILSIKSDALVFYPGAYGTLNELFEYVTLIQIGLMDKVPVILVGKKYWSGLLSWLKGSPVKQGFYIDPKRDLDLIKFTDDISTIIKIIKKR